MPAPSKEASIILALSALENDEDIMVTTVAKIYNIKELARLSKS